EDVTVTREQMLQVHEGARTEAGLRENIRVGVQYIEAWLRGKGAVPLYNLMEDAATAEICRTQIWQWIQQKAALDDGRMVSAELVKTLMADEMNALKAAIPFEAFKAGRFAEAIAIFADLCLSEKLTEFLTLPAYEALA
ncbi:MAG: malate synthase A, partial [Caulobacteraceae bacterium]|nr:malate synthase A [Caulobacteraceae bacterium]